MNPLGIPNPDTALAGLRNCWARQGCCGGAGADPWKATGPTARPRAADGHPRESADTKESGFAEPCMLGRSG